MAFGGEATGQRLGLVGVMKAGNSCCAFIRRRSEAISYSLSFSPSLSLPLPPSLPPEYSEMAAIPTPIIWEFQTLSSSPKRPGGITSLFPCPLIQVSLAHSPYWESKMTPALSKQILINKNYVPGSEVKILKQHRPGSRLHQVHTLRGVYLWGNAGKGTRSDRHCVR